MNGYKRTCGYRNWINRRAFLPDVSGGVATLASGREYDVVVHPARHPTKDLGGLSHQYVGAPKPRPRTKAEYKAAAIAGQANNQQPKVRA
jgi:hypothetical protein